MDAYFEVRIPAATNITHELLTDLECVGRLSRCVLNKARVLLHHGQAIMALQPGEFGTSLSTPEPPATLQGAPVNYVIGAYSTFEYVKAQ